MSDDLSQLSMFELFRLEAENQTSVLTAALLALERGDAAPQTFESLMRATHSLKGAARIINLKSGVSLAHSMEDCFVAAHRGEVRLQHAQIDVLLRAVDILTHLARNADPASGSWEQDHAEEIKGCLTGLAAILPAGAVGPAPAHRGDTETVQRKRAAVQGEPMMAPFAPRAGEGRPGSDAIATGPPGTPERVVRLAAENLNRLLGLAGESLVESRWLGPFADSLQRLRRYQMQLAERIDLVRQSVEDEALSARTRGYFNDLYRHMAEAQEFLGRRLEELDLYERRSSHLSQRLYLEVLRTRMRPFSDGVRRFPRMVRDLARPLGKQVRLEIFGDNTQVDRDILERLETPLAHLLRNAIDHGCETPAQRRQAGKPEEGTLRLEARHSAGVLVVSVSDDGAGVEVERVRAAILRNKLASPAAVSRMSDPEVLEFLFLPGFTLKETVTEISGRGFGLDVVQNMAKSVRGSVRLANQPGRGFRVQLQLPLTLSVLRALLVEIGGEPYAFPLSQIARTLTLPRDHVQVLEGRRHFQYAGQPIALVTAHEVLECVGSSVPAARLPVVLLGERNALYGLVVNRFLGERELVVQPLDPRLGKIRNISSAALMEDGSPVLILEIDELVRSIEDLARQGRLVASPRLGPAPGVQPIPRILVVEDSLSVRELVGNLLTAQGFAVDLAADGLEAWAALQLHRYQLVISDVDMPRMNGIELTVRIKNDSRLKAIPVLIVSYKDSEDDRMHGLEAGADHYLTKGAFQGEGLLKAVADLIGEPGQTESARE